MTKELDGAFPGGVEGMPHLAHLCKSFMYTLCRGYCPYLNGRKEPFLEASQHSLNFVFDKVSRKCVITVGGKTQLQVFVCACVRVSAHRFQSRFSSS